MFTSRLTRQPTGAMAMSRGHPAARPATNPGTLPEWRCFRGASTPAVRPRRCRRVAAAARRAIGHIRAASAPRPPACGRPRWCLARPRRQRRGCWTTAPLRCLRQKVLQGEDRSLATLVGHGVFTEPSRVVVIVSSRGYGSQQEHRRRSLLSRLGCPTSRSPSAVATRRRSSATTATRTTAAV